MFCPVILVEPPTNLEIACVPDDLFASPSETSYPASFAEFSSTPCESSAIGNVHPIVTWSKAEVFKPKMFLVEATEYELRKIIKAFDRMNGNS